MIAIDRPPAHQAAGVTVYLGGARDVLGALPAATMDCHNGDRVCAEPPRFPCKGRRVGRVAHADVRVAILDGVVLGHDHHLLVVDGFVSCHGPSGDLACASRFSESTR